MNSSILIYGYGNMTSAMVAGWIASGIEPARFTIFNPSVKEVPQGTVFTNRVPNEAFDWVVPGFKPHMLADVAPEMRKCVGARTVILSVLAGVELATLQEQFAQASGVVRFMPNLAVAMGKSPNSLIAAGLDAEQRASVSDLAQRLGSAEWIEDEALFDLATALAGSGPGFVYRFIDALADAGAQLGLPADQAQRMAVQMVEGAGALAARSDASPASLADRVASPGGMTREGLNILDDGDALKGLLARTLKATADKGGELAKRARKDG